MPTASATTDQDRSGAFHLGDGSAREADLRGAGIVLVPHTHWDREWYEPFQVFRLRLVNVLDEVIERAEADPGFRFTLDGQLATVHDYLEIRPEQRERVRALVESGQLSVGPWQILLDEFLCAGETIVRNLELGWRGAEAVGGAMPVGYLPDMFGHCAQMPQILARAGIRHAALWRGVPAAVDRHGFRWTAPDGSAVRVEYLFDGYGNALDLFAIPARLGDAVGEYVEETRSWYGEDAVLGMLGTDHSAPRADLMELARAANLPVAGLAEYVSRHDPDQPDLPVVVGELRSHARGNILPGVISIRVGLKQAMALAERTLRDAEAIAAQRAPQGSSPEPPQEPPASFDPFLGLAWRKVVESTAHDSVTGCGVDETADQVAARLAEATHLARAVTDRAVAEAAAAVPSDGAIVVNTLPFARTVLVELDAAVPGDLSAAGEPAPMSVVTGDGARLPVQDLGGFPTVLSDETVPAAELVDRMMRRIHGRELFGQQIDGYEVTPGRLRVDVAPAPSAPDFDLAALRAELTEAVAATPGAWSVRIVARPRRLVLAAVPVPASGHLALRPRPGAVADTGPRVRVEGWTLDNGDVAVEVAADGTLTVRGVDGTTLTGVGRLASGGDRGDSYNYGPPAADVVVDRPATVRVDATETGPLRAVLTVVREYDWPVALSDDPDVRSVETVRVPVVTSVELRVGEPFVRVDVSFTNPARDHRVRWHVPLPAAVSSSAADGQFAVTTRGLSAEGGWGEYPLPTFPASTFVTAGEATVLVDHVTEYELVADGADLALTLLRAVGMMSVNVHPLRDEPAGSEFTVPCAQYLGVPVRARLAVLPHAGGWSAADAPRWSEVFRHDAVVAAGTGPAADELPSSEQGVDVGGAGVVVSSLRRVDDDVEVRLVAMSDEPTTATITGPFAAARRTDLLGRRLGDPLDAAPLADGSFRAGLDVELGAWEIVTLRLAT